MGTVESNIVDPRDSHHVGGRLIRNPFDPQAVVEHLEWCRTCKMDVDVIVEAGNADEVDVYRKTCKRCGKVIQYGMGRRHIDGSSTRPLPDKALEFIRKTGRNRR